MKFIIMVGLPGSGKGTQATLLAKKLNFQHLSTGEILRREIEQKTELGDLAAQSIHDGNFIPDNVSMEIVQKAIDERRQEVDGFVLDGFPRNIPQAVAFEEYLSKTGGTLLKVIRLDVPVNVATERLLRRGERANRTDDNESVIHKRIDIYYQSTHPLIDFYDQYELLIHVNGENSIEEVNENIFDAVKTVE
ncbi:MAG: adenylate kinase [Bacteroidales bacterium]|jgi:adenylate kinase|nr:adenylate kinase [Bacteroidales bacterium]